MYFLISSFLNFLIKFFRLLKVEGKENLPADSKYIVTCSHKGWVDVIMLAIAVYPTQVHFMAKKELFNSKISEKFLRSINAFPVNRENPGPSALKIPLKLLKENKCVGIFPGGTRTSDEVPLKKGAATISVKANAPLIPAAYFGPKNFADIVKGQKAIVKLGKAIEIPPESIERDEMIETTLVALENEIVKLERSAYGTNEL